MGYTNHKHKDLLIAYTIDAFDTYFEEAKNKKNILEIVYKQLDSKSPKTMKNARKFIKKWEQYPME